MPKKSLKTTNNTLITKFFHQTTNSSKIAINSEKTSENLNFYESCLLEKIELCGQEKHCHEEKDKLRQKHGNITEKLTKIHKAHSVCLKICEKKDNQIKNLKDKIQLLKSTSSITCIDKRNIPSSNESKLVLEEFKDVLSDEQLSTLRSINKTAGGDSTFVLKCVRFVYSDNLEKLQHISVKGQSKETQSISPIKMNRLKSLYHSRLANMDSTTEERRVREVKFERHVHNAIMNIRKALKKASEMEKVICTAEK